MRGLLSGALGLGISTEVIGECVMGLSVAGPMVL